MTDGLRGSACLDFADLLLEAGALHVGGPTYADTSYMELRTEALPSGAGRLAFAIKVYRGRKRASGRPHVPKRRWTGDFSDTAGLERWVLGLAEAR